MHLNVRRTQVRWTDLSVPVRVRYGYAESDSPTLQMVDSCVHIILNAVNGILFGEGRGGDRRGGEGGVGRRQKGREGRGGEETGGVGLAHNHSTHTCAPSHASACMYALYVHI